MGLLNLIYTILNIKLSASEYELNIILTDKNNIIIHQEIKVFQNYNLAQVDSLINELKKVGNEKK